ncbi:hypothetical protein SAMN02910340_01392 [Methanosarcina thermophila]|jgi:hypothetical protein|uniref:Uncharacterized protein n=3 Tax=Methanosarcina thermophila TaxID=2210 RepID=A0A0E3NH56_METTE|nr:hypothetical protein MSTHT_0129 [Methanosarcina thermophila TM-1]AKB14917.1 hypothetical protein MSTHC_0599 [Methanosarcina thermophila CHTI-55]SFT59290.1 hypothetical protein SAMN02910340_01392 [Methanosarcina thermophila]
MWGLNLQQIFQNVIINRQELNSIEFEKESIEIPLSPGGEETFEILITNYGSPTHIHLSVSEELKGLITFLRDNPYVLQKEYVSAVARIPQEGKTLIQGQIFITAGYGSRKRGFPVQLGKTDTKPQEHPRDEVYAVDEEEELNSQKPVTRISGSRSANGSGRFSSFIRKSFTGGFPASAGRRTYRNVSGNERLSLNMAFGGVLLLIGLFFLYFILPSGLQFKVSFAQSLLFSILFVTCMTYVLLRIAEEG